MRQFTASTPEDAERATVPFSLDGVYAKSKRWPEGTEPRTTWVEEFEAMGMPPAALATSLQNAVLLDERGQQALNPGVIMAFIEAILVDESANRFRSLVNDKDRLVKLTLLGDVFQWLSEEVVGRPTQALLPSSAGQTPTGPTS